jgi:hypothetical protein
VRSALPRLLLSIAALLLLAAAVPAEAQADVSAVPSNFSAGARISVTATGLAPNANYRIRLEELRPGVRDFDLIDFSSSLASNRRLSVNIPTVAPGRYEITLSRVQLGVTRIAATPVTVAAGLGVNLTPSTGAPGRRISFTVNNLVNGTLRVSYAGQTVLGPVPVGTSYSGGFLVPSDRPATLPATVPIVVENLVGRLVARSATVNFQALRASTLPRLGLQQPVVPTNQLIPRTFFPVSGSLTDSFGLVPAGQQSLYFIGGGVTIPIDSSSTLSNNGTLQMTARAPDAYLDGISANSDRAGELRIVNRGIDVNSGARQNGQFRSVNDLPIIVDGRDANRLSFSVIVKGRRPDGTTFPLRGAIVYADALYESAFLGFIRSQNRSVDGGPVLINNAANTDGRQLYGSTLPNQFTDYPVHNGLGIGNTPRFKPENYGCTQRFFRKITTDQGRVTFFIGRDEITDVGVFRIPPCIPAGTCNPEPENPTQSTSGTFYNESASFSMAVAGAHLGYRSGYVAIGFDADNDLFLDQSTGELFVNNTVEVVLEASALSDFDLRDMRIDGVGPAEKRDPQTCGFSPECFFEPMQFKSMTVFPSTARWPDSAFDARNTGRKVRLPLDTTVYGPISSGRIRIGNTPWASFAVTGTTPSCLLDAGTEVTQGQVEYIATLPDLTRLPKGVVSGQAELRFGNTPTRTFSFELTTEEPLMSVLDANGNPNSNIASLRIVAGPITQRLEGNYNIPGLRIDVNPPPGDTGIGRLDSSTVNDGGFELTRDADGAEKNRIFTASDNDIAANDGATKGGSLGLFGFTNANYNTPARTTLFDTGLIPLFRYSFGIPPIAAATLGADFWMAASVAFYGQLKPEGMNANIDPRLAGGVNIFFDLDVLAGLVSASISANSELAITMRSKINQGGFAHLSNTSSPASGRCFTFSLDAVFEACAVFICASDEFPVFPRIEAPSNCDSSAINSGPLMLRGIAGPDKALPDDLNGFDLARPRYTATAIGGDGRGHAVTVGVSENGDLIATHVSGGVVEAARTIATGTVAVQHVDVAYYASDRAMAVWSESRLSFGAVRTLMQTQGARAFDDIARAQRLRFSQWDGRTWTAPADLTSRGSDGKPQLAGCVPPVRSFGFTSCPSGGEITAVWERDANDNLDAPDLEIWSSRWTPARRSWTVAERVSSTGVSSDMLPSVAYRNGVPIAAWARNPGGAFANLNARHIAYRLLDGSAQVNATGLGNAVGWVDIGVAANDDVVLAYTRAQDARGFVGNRQALNAARATTCTSGVCSFTASELRDPNGRQFRVERPRVAFDETDTPMITFRGLAFGPDAQGRHALPGDLPGITLGTGELGMVRVGSFAQPRHTAQIVGLSDNGLQHWKPDAIFDETMGGLLAVSMQAQAPLGKRLPMEIAKQMSPEGSSIAPMASELGGGAMLRMATAGPDFEIRNARLSRQVASAGQSVTLTLDLVNIGSGYVPAEHGSVQVFASLNGPAGAAPELRRVVLTTSAATNSSRELVMTFNMPAGVVSDELQTIFVDIVAGEDANAADGTSDHDRIEMNAMPVPTALNTAVRPDSPFVHITWANPNDTRVFGWRVWKLGADGSWIHLGSTRNPGYADITSEFATPQTYRVAAFSANGMESEPSEPVTGTPEQTRSERVFSDGFEGAAS